MAHTIAGFAGPFDALAAAAGLAGHPVARLGCDWGFLPVDRTGDPADPAFPGVERLTPALAAWAARASNRSPLVYFETEYHGGVGAQAAVAWVDGAVVARGRTPSTTFDDQANWAINAAARAAGLRPDPDGDADEFDALGLGENRTNDGWAEAAAWTALAAQAAAQPPEHEPAPPPTRFRPVPTPTAAGSRRS